jgi:hypothetical protein
MLPLDMQAAMLRLTEKQKALADYLDSGGRDKRKCAELLGDVNQAMQVLTTAINKFSEGSSTIQ